MKPTTLPEALAQICATNAPLGARLAAYARAMRDLKSPYADEYDRLVERLRAGAAGAGAPSVGEFMPPFLLPDPAGRLVGLEQLLARGPVVISFNRGHWCPFCRIELASLAEAHRDFVGLDAQVASIMPERQQFTSAVQARLGDGFRVLTDVDNGYALQLGLAMWVGDPIRALMTDRDQRLERYQGNNAWLLPRLGEAAIVEIRIVEAAARRLAKSSIEKRPSMSSFSAVVDYCRTAMAFLDHEEFRILFLDKKNFLIADEVQGVGTVDHAPVYPREIMRRALELGASALILVHNHPSGDPEPSTEDIYLTHQIIAVGKSLKIVVHDHLIVGKHGHASLKGMRLI